MMRALDDDVHAAAVMQEYEAKIAALERMVGRQALEPPPGDEVLVGMLAAGELLRERKQWADLNSILVSALKEEAAGLHGHLSLVPGSPPPVLIRPWPIRMVLRRLLLQVRTSEGRVKVETGGRRPRAWIRLTFPRRIDADTEEFAVCRRIAREHGGDLRFRGRVIVLSLPAA